MYSAIVISGKSSTSAYELLVGDLAFVEEGETGASTFPTS